MNRSVLMVHYTPPSVIGGVEQVIQKHIELLLDRGFHVEVVAGRAASEDIGSRVHVLPEIDVARPESAEIETELSRGLVSERFLHQAHSIAASLTPLTDAFDVVIAHNAFTLHFSLALTEVLWDIAKHRKPGSMFAWCHDLTWTNPLYIPSAQDTYPWTLLRTPAPNTDYVTVSEERKRELGALWGSSGESITVIPNGIDPQAFLRLTPLASQIARDYALFERELIVILPVRVTRRKNIELAIRAVGCLRDQGCDVLFLISGPTAPHHPGRSRDYLAELKALRGDLGLDRNVIFLADELDQNLDDATVASLYSIADALLFPSSQEGFGLPILEAGLAKLPVVAANIPIFREIGGQEVVLFDLQEDPDTIAASVRKAVEGAPARLYRRVRRRYRWDAIADSQIVPLLTQRTSKVEGSRQAAEEEG